MQEQAPPPAAALARRRRPSSHPTPLAQPCRHANEAGAASDRLGWQFTAAAMTVALLLRGVAAGSRPLTRACLVAAAAAQALALLLATRRGCACYVRWRELFCVTAFLFLLPAITAFSERPAGGQRLPRRKRLPWPQEHQVTRSRLPTTPTSAAQTRAARSASCGTTAAARRACLC